MNPPRMSKTTCLRGIGSREQSMKPDCPENGLTARAPEVCLQVPTEATRIIPFARVVGSLLEWEDGVISDDDLCKSLRKAASEVARGGF